ncbi:MAG: hypothetical protein EBQ96_09060 [Proteobacteria bacterium]|nr:hypothetical protein [Pseudomonadota bacterium]
MTALTAAPLASEIQPVETWKREDIFRLVHEGRRMVNPVPLENGGFYYPQGGAYHLFRTPDGRRVGIWAADPDDLVLETMNVTEDLSKSLKMNDKNGKEVCVPVGTQLPNRLKDLGNGNLDRLRVFTVRPHRLAEKWFMDEMHKHQRAYLAFVETHGTAFRISKTLWLSDGIVYRAVPCDEAGSDRYDLMMFVAPGHGWNLSSGHEQIFQGLSGRFMRSASLRKRGLTLSEVEALVESDFKKRAPLFFDGIDTYTVELNGDAKKKPSMTYRLRKFQMRFAYAMSQMRGAQVAKTAGGVFFGNALLMSLLWALGIPVSPILAAGKAFGQTVSNTGKDVLEYMRLKKALLGEEGIESLLKLFCEKWNDRQLWGGRLKRSMVPYLRAMDHSELNTDLTFGDHVQQKLPEDLSAMEYIFGTLQGPPGSIGTPFRVGQYTGIRISEPGGLTVEYIPEKFICYARLDWARLDSLSLPESVSRLFQKQPEGKHYLKVWYDRSDRKLKNQSMDREAYMADFSAVCAMPFEPPVTLAADPVTLVTPQPEGGGGLLHQMAEEGIGVTASEAVTTAAEKVAESLPRGPFRP